MLKLVLMLSGIPVGAFVAWRRPAVSLGLTVLAGAFVSWLFLQIIFSVITVSGGPRHESETARAVAGLLMHTGVYVVLAMVGSWPVAAIRAWSLSLVKQAVEKEVSGYGLKFSTENKIFGRSTQSLWMPFVHTEVLDILPASGRTVPDRSPLYWKIHTQTGAAGDWFFIKKSSDALLDGLQSVPNLLDGLHDLCSSTAGFKRLSVQAGVLRLEFQTTDVEKILSASSKIIAIANPLSQALKAS